MQSPRNHPSRMPILILMSGFRNHPQRRGFPVARTLAITALAGLGVATAHPAGAQTWFGPAGGDFNTAGYWNPSGVPTSASAATNLSADSIVVSTGDSESVASFSSTGGADFDMTGGELDVATSFVTTSALNITGDGLLNVSGTLTAGSLIMNGQPLYQGYPIDLTSAEVENATIQNTAITTGGDASGSVVSALFSNVTFDTGTSLAIGARSADYFNKSVFSDAALAAGVNMSIAAQSTLYLMPDSDGIQTLGADNGSLTVNMTDNAAITIDAYEVSAGHTPYPPGLGLGLGKDVNINIQGHYAMISALNIENYGTINVSGTNSEALVASGVAEVYPSTLYGALNNEGTLEATASGAVLYVHGQYDPFSNIGLVNASNGGQVYLYNVYKLGNVTVDSNPNSAVFLTGDGIVNGNLSTLLLSPSDFSHVQLQYGGGGLHLLPGAEIYIPANGTFDPTAMNVSDGVHATDSYSLFRLDGGTIASPDSDDKTSFGHIEHSDQLLFGAEGGTLSNVVLDGSSVTGVLLNIYDSFGNAPVVLEFGGHEISAGNNARDFNVGTVPGHGDAYFAWAGSAGKTDEFDTGGGHVVVSLGSASTNGYIGFGSTSTPGTTTNDFGIEFLSTATLQGAGGIGATSEGTGYGNWIVNDGLIDANIASTSLFVYSGYDYGAGELSYIDNTGTIEATTSGTQLSIQSGVNGPVTNEANAIIAATGGSAVTISGGSFTNSGEVNVGTGSSLALNSTTSTQTAGATIVDGTLSVTNATNTYTLSGGTLNGMGSTAGNGTITGNVNATGTDVFAGDKNIATSVITPGTLTVTGNYTQSGGALDVGLSASATSLLAVTGTATLSGGTIGVEVTGGYVPMTGNTYTVLTGSSVSAAFTNPTGTLNVIADSTQKYDFTVSSTGSSVRLTYLGLGGSSMNVPALPSSTSGLSFIFKQISSGMWVDPALASGYMLQTTDGSLFTGITLPTGFDAPFTVSVGGTSLGTFSGGSNVDFTALSGGGTDEFSITGIDPEVDSGNPTAFPVETDFNNPTADLTMTPGSGASAPEPGALALMFMGIASSCLGFARNHYRRQLA